MNILYMKIKNQNKKVKLDEGNKKSDKIKKDRPKTCYLEKTKKYKDDNPYEKMFV